MNDANNAGTLAPCPFCKSRCVTAIRNVQGWKVVKCDDCGARGPCIDLEGDQYIDRWNALSTIRKDGIYLVWSNEHSAWWGPNRAGYNTHISHAGRYTREEAIAICVRARGGREFNSNPSEVPIPLKDAEAFWTEDGLEERYRRESRERKEEYEREEIEAAIRNGGKQP